MIRKNNYNWGIAIVFLLACNSSFAQVKLGDNLGTHSANKALVMNGNDINSVRVINAEGMVIGTASMVDNASIALQVNANDKAILLPRVTDLLNTTSPSIANPVEGMIVYDLATHKFYIRNNNTWTTYLTTNLAEGHILVGDANGMPQPVAVSGDVNLQSTGEMTVGNLKITNAKLANGSVDNAKLLADAVTTDKIVNLAVTAGKVGSGAGVNKVLTTDNTGNNIWVDRSQFASTTLNSGQILLGNSANVATAVVPSGDVTITDAGVTVIGTGKVQTGMLAGNAVISSKILDANVTGTKLASDAVTSDKIKDLEVSTADLANAAVTEVKIAPDAVTTVKIANANVTAAKLANAPAGGDLFNKVLTTDASGNNTWADKTKITLPAMTDKQVIVANGTTPAAVTMSGDATIGNTGAITIATGAVNSAKIADGTVTGTDIATGTVTSTNILDATIASADIANNAITTVKIANANVTSAKLANAPAGGDLFNKVLTTDASGNNTWADKSKITLPAMTDMQVIVANGTTPAAVTMSGDASISNTGALTIATAAVNSAKIADGTVTGTDIASGTVTSDNILDATIAAADIASNAVTTNKILNGNVTVNKLGTAGISDADKIYTTDAAGKPTLVSSLSAAKIANGTVSDTEYQTLDGVTSGIQNQLDAISVGLVPVGSVTAWFPNLLSSATLPANFVECNGQVISDAQSPLDGVTIPNLNGGSYLTGTTGTTGTSVGSNSLTLTMANLPNTTISGTSSAVSAGTPAGTISVATAGAHTHTMTPVTSLYGDDIGNTNGGDGQAIRVEETNSAGAHTHTATFTGTAMATHSHTTNINLNGGVTQTAINNRPQSFTVRWIMRIK